MCTIERWFLSSFYLWEPNGTFAGWTNVFVFIKIPLKFVCTVLFSGDSFKRKKIELVEKKLSPSFPGHFVIEIKTNSKWTSVEIESRVIHNLGQSNLTQKRIAQNSKQSHNPSDCILNAIPVCTEHVQMKTIRTYAQRIDYLKKRKHAHTHTVANSQTYFLRMSSNFTNVMWVFVKRKRVRFFCYLFVSVRAFHLDHFPELVYFFPRLCCRRL